MVIPYRVLKEKYNKLWQLILMTEQWKENPVDIYFNSLNKPRMRNMRFEFLLYGQP